MGTLPLQGLPYGQPPQPPELLQHRVRSRCRPRNRSCSGGDASWGRRDAQSEVLCPDGLPTLWSSGGSRWLSSLAGAFSRARAFTTRSRRRPGGPRRGRGLRQLRMRAFRGQLDARPWSLSPRAPAGSARRVPAPGCAGCGHARRERCGLPARRTQSLPLGRTPTVGTRAGASGRSENPCRSRPRGRPPPRG